MVSPSVYKTKNVGLTNYYSRYLFQRAISVFDWKNIPEFWDIDYMLYVLYTMGFLAVVDTREFGVIPQYCTLSGYDVFYRPTTANISNQAFANTITAKIGEDCELMRLTPDYCGILDLVTFYAEMMAAASEAVGVNMMNVKTTPIFKAQSKSEAETLKKMYDSVARGEPCVVVDGNVAKIAENGKGFDWFCPPTSGMFVTNDILQSMRTIENMFDTAIGIPNSNTQKRERLITDEVNSNNFETKSVSGLWLDTLKQSLDKINSHFGLSIAVDWKEDLNGTLNDNPTSAVSSESDNV